MATMDLNLLRAFLAVAETSSFSAAARKLGVPKSSVSRAVAALEEQMNVRLLHRTTRHVAPTTAGRALHDRVAPLLASLESAVCGLPELEDQPSGRLRVTTTVDFGSAVLGEIVARFVEAHPAVFVDLRLTSGIVDLVAEGFDLALRFGSRTLPDSSLNARRAGTVRLQLFASPDYLARAGTPRRAEDLAEHQWVAFRRETPLRLEGPGGASLKVEQRGRILCDDMSFVRTAVRAGAGVGLLPTFLAAEDVEAGALVRVLPKWDTRSGTLWLVSPHTRHVPRKVSAFRDFVIAALATRPVIAPIAAE
jgi:DNA-binding transcriptional LysR family regulator